MASAGNRVNQGKTSVFQETCLPFILLCAGILIWYYGDSSRGIRRRGLPDSWTVKVRPYWSEMINVPVGRDAQVVREDKKPFEICYWSQQLGECLNGAQLVKKEKWFSNVRASSFRIRGEEGFATVTVDR